MNGPPICARPICFVSCSLPVNHLSQIERRFNANDARRTALLLQLLLLVAEIEV